MGNNHPSLISSTSYGRNLSCIEYLQKEFWLSKSDLQQFFNIFLEIYKMNPRYQHLISITEFLIYFHIESNSIHKLIFGWLSTSRQQQSTSTSSTSSSSTSLAFSFIEFVTILCTFLALNDQEFGKFVFVLFDSNGDGYLEYEEITHLIHILKREDNVKLRPFMNILAELTHSERISYNLSQFEIFFKKHTALTNPFRQLKCELQRACLGSHYWEQKLIDRLNPLKRQTKFANLEQYPVIAHEVNELLYMMEKEANDPESMKRYFINPKYIEWGEHVGNEEEKKGSRHTLPAPNTSQSAATTSGAKKRELRRGISNDDMLDTNGKLHSQPSGRRLQQQKTQKQLQTIGGIMEVYTTPTSGALPKIRAYEEDDTLNNEPKIKGKSSIDKSPSAESHPLTITTSLSSKSQPSKQPSSTNLLPSVSRRGGSLNSPHTPLLRVPSGTRLVQPLVQPKGAVVAAANRKLLRKYSSDDMLR